MARFTNTSKNPNQSNNDPQIILPPNYNPMNNNGFDDEEKVPFHQRLGDLSDQVFEFIFNPNTIKFGILLFGAVCAGINLAGYHDLAGELFNTRLDEYGRVFPVDAPASERLLSTLIRIPILGNLIAWLDQLVGNTLAALIVAFAFWFVVQGFEIASRFHLYFPQASQNLLFKENRKKFEQPTANNPGAKKAYKWAVGHTMTLLRLLALVGVIFYLVDAYGMHIVRPWIDNVSDPLWLNIIWNSLAVFGVELAMILYRGYQAVTLSAQSAKNTIH